MMSKKLKTALLVTFLTIPVITLAVAGKQEPFSAYVDDRGAITLPTDFRPTWAHLGTWVLTSQVAAGPEQPRTSPVSGLHDVYTQPESLKAYKTTGEWPDGAVLIKEIRTIVWDDLPTGHVMYAGDESEWLVMVKDSRGRFKDHPNWSEGWGWALFKPGDSPKNMSTDCKKDCIGCHEVVRDTDWVFVQGYPSLR